MKNSPAKPNDSASSRSSTDDPLSRCPLSGSHEKRDLIQYSMQIFISIHFIFNHLSPVYFVVHSVNSSCLVYKRTMCYDVMHCKLVVKPIFLRQIFDIEYPTPIQ